MKSYYIESINLWIICVNVDGHVDAKIKDAIRKEWRKQVHTAKDIVVLDQSIAPFEFIGKSDIKAIKQSELKYERLSQMLGQ
ncbi:hypothetical protein GBO93_09565 [Pediococcus acidilactici]|nr:hypothetical protein GBO20_06030 [Pediococcus acidilactici]KAF0344457.1 hypothetical protein GBO43_06795 [Pediococcus acidilactici]KAF0352766.1 hypothetical protein GBO47_09525 [Pediococcus acidilactici]KAF0356970.1 hypothetical protein GBO51_09835 [Pediococcus acidilactici]KAF0362303.1 hypothetical protein GBO53_07745 [Pediococcus acidilactici]